MVPVGRDVSGLICQSDSLYADGGAKGAVNILKFATMSFWPNVIACSRTVSFVFVSVINW